MIRQVGMSYFYEKVMKMRKKENNKPVEKIKLKKKLLIQESLLIWVVTLAFIVLAFVCVFNQYFGELPWITAMCGFPWTAYGVTRSFHLNKSKAENTVNGITFETALKELEMQRELYL